MFTELANSVKSRRQCSLDALSDHLHKALEDLDIALKSQPRLFLGSNKENASDMPAAAAAQESQKQEKETKPSSSGKKTDSSTSASLERAPEVDQKTLRPQMSNIAIITLEFSEALPFACFASLPVEIVARLDSVIEEVEELARVVQFKEFIICKLQQRYTKPNQKSIFI